MNEEKVIKMFGNYFHISSNCGFNLYTMECKHRCKNEMMTTGDYKCPLGVIRTNTEVYEKLPVTPH